MQIGCLVGDDALEQPVFVFEGLQSSRIIHLPRRTSSHLYNVVSVIPMLVSMMYQ